MQNYKSLPPKYNTEVDDSNDAFQVYKNISNLYTNENNY